MTVKRNDEWGEYMNLAGQLLAHPQQCSRIDSPCHAGLWRRTEAASISLDLANAEASIERTRAGIAWA